MSKANNPLQASREATLLRSVARAARIRAEQDQKLARELESSADALELTVEVESFCIFCKGVGEEDCTCP